MKLPARHPMCLNCGESLDARPCACERFNRIFDATLWVGLATVAAVVWLIP